MKKEFFSVATQDSKQNNGIQLISNMLGKTRNLKNILRLDAHGPVEPPPPPPEKNKNKLTRCRTCSSSYINNCFIFSVA